MPGILVVEDDENLNRGMCFMKIIAHIVKERVKLPPLRVLCGGRV